MAEVESQEVVEQDNSSQLVMVVWSENLDGVIAEELKKQCVLCCLNFELFNKWQRQMTQYEALKYSDGLYEFKLKLWELLRHKVIESVSISLSYTV